MGLPWVQGCEKGLRGESGGVGREGWEKREEDIETSGHTKRLLQYSGWELMRTNRSGVEKEDAVENLSGVGLSERPTLDVFAYRGFKLGTERKGKYHSKKPWSYFICSRGSSSTGTGWMPCTLNSLPWRTFRQNRETSERVQEATGQGKELSMSFQHRDVGVTPLASGLGNGPPNWKSTTKRSEEISIGGRCLNGFV